MFERFKKHNPFKALTEERKKWIADNLQRLDKLFNHVDIKTVKIFTPTQEDFPVDWNGSEESANIAAKIIAKNMRILWASMEVEYFDENTESIKAVGRTVKLPDGPDAGKAAGMFFQKDRHGKYLVAIDKQHLFYPDNLIAIIAHEFAHIKLLGEKKMEKNDEDLTDLTALFFGFGIFNANASFQVKRKGFRLQTRQLGYLKPLEWTYALALMAYMQGDHKPSWSKHLSFWLRTDFKNYLYDFIDNNEEA